MNATNYAARAWLLKNRQRLEKAKREAEKLRSEQEAILESLCGPMGRVMP